MTPDVRRLSNHIREAALFRAEGSVVRAIHLLTGDLVPNVDDLTDAELWDRLVAVSVSAAEGELT